MKLTLLTARRLALVVGLSLLASDSARANDYYVDAAGGNNANGGSSPVDAWQTITHALASIPGGPQTVHVAPGLYDSGLGESFPLTLRSQWALVGDAGRDVTIVDGGGAAVLVDGIGAVSPRVQGLWLRNASLGVDMELEWGNDGRILLQDVLLSDMQRGISGYVIGVTPDYETVLRVELVRSTIRDCTDEGVHLLAESMYGDFDWSQARLELEESRIEGCGVGAWAWSDFNVESYGNVILERSVLVGNGTGCSAESLAARGSTVHGSSLRGLHGGSMSVRNSIVYGNGNDLYCPSGWLTVEYSDIGEGAAGIGNISADPLFVDAASGDFRLRFWSPCADAGNPALGLGTFDGDLDTEKRLDMGAFELAPLVVNGTPQVGQTFDLELWGPANGVALVYVARGLPVDRPFPTPYGELELARRRAVLFGVGATAPGPPGSVQVPVPNNPSLVGATFTFQALSTSSVRDPRLAWTNAVVVTIAP